MVSEFDFVDGASSALIKHEKIWSAITADARGADDEPICPLPPSKNAVVDTAFLLWGSNAVVEVPKTSK